LNKEIDSSVKEIWETYFSTTNDKFSVDPQVRDELAEKFQKGAPYSPDFYDPCVKIVFNNALNIGDFPFRVRGFATGAVYK